MEEERTQEIASRIVHLLGKKGWTMTTVESCTGGMVSAAVTSVAGSSAVFRQGLVTYCDEAKHQMAGVCRKTLRKYTAVSAKTALEMARGGAKLAKAECSVSVTGYAGPPTGAEDEMVGLVFIACSIRKKSVVRELHLSGSRNEVRARAAQEALRLLEKQLLRSGSPSVISCGSAKEGCQKADSDCGTGG